MISVPPWPSEVALKFVSEYCPSKVRFSIAVSGLLIPRPDGRVACFKPVHPLGHVASPPAAHGQHAVAHSRRHLKRANPLTGQKHDP